MADPVTASIALACGAIKLGSSLARFFDEQRANKLRRASFEPSSTNTTRTNAELEEAKRKEQKQKCLNAEDEVLFVLAVLGQRILHLEVVSFQYIPEVLKMVQSILPDEMWEERLSRLDQSLQYAAVIGMFFCAECWPMHIYQGFGAAVLNNFTWINPDPEAPAGPSGSDEFWRGGAGYEMDNMLASLKSLPRPPLLTKVPTGMSTVQPDFNTLKLSEVPTMKMKRSRKKELLELQEHLQDCIQALNQSGHPSPKNGSYKVRTWTTLWATWDSPFACTRVPDRELGDVIFRQSDPGRLLYAFTIGGHLELKEGEIAATADDYTNALILWLHGLPGTSFDIVPNSELDWSTLKFKKSTMKYFKKKGLDIEREGFSNPHAFNVIPGRKVPSKAAPQPSLAPPAYTDTRRLSATSVNDLEKHMATVTVASVEPEVTTIAVPVSPTATSPTLPRRRPAPVPQALPIRRVRVMYDFCAEDPGELNVQSGVVLDVLKDLGDGWVEARLPSGEVGTVPESFTIPV